MFSLAAINYRDVFTSDGGPIDRVSSGSIDVLGKQAHQANAYLAPGLIRGKPALCVYGNADGTGASGSAQVARHMAISEALERWAFYELSQGDESAKYGFDVDNSTNGMAAFPGLLNLRLANAPISRPSSAGRSSPGGPVTCARPSWVTRCSA